MFWHTWMLPGREGLWYCTSATISVIKLIFVPKHACVLRDPCSVQKWCSCHCWPCLCYRLSDWNCDRLCFPHYSEPPMYGGSQSYALEASCFQKKKSASASPWTSGLKWASQLGLVLLSCWPLWLATSGRKIKSKLFHSTCHQFWLWLEILSLIDSLGQQTEISLKQ